MPPQVEPTGASPDTSLDERVRDRLFALNEFLLGKASAQDSIALRDVLRRLVELARELTGARYGALGVFSRGGTEIRDFVHSGMSEESVRAIGRLPTGRGLLGAVIREGRAIRVGSIGADPRSCGVPAGHPPMTTFLGMPLRLGAESFGNFYLADKEGGVEFSEADEALLSKFAAQAGITVAFARQLQAEEQRLLEAVVRHAPSGLVYFPADPGQEPLWNTAAARMLGRVSRATDPDCTFLLTHVDGRPLADEELPVSRAQREGVVVNLEVLIHRRDLTAGPRPALISTAPVYAPSGPIIGVVLVLQDISTRKELERLREDFAAMVAHDLRTPLQAVLLQVESLLRQSVGDAATVSVATLLRLKANGRRIESLVRDLIDASRIEAGHVVLALRPIDVAAMVASLALQIEAAIGPRRIHVEAGEGEYVVDADQLRLEQVVTNLIENAAKYSAEGEAIRISLARRAGGVEVSVVDRGPGIAPAELPHLFDRYYQTRRARAAGLGLGLGLFIARGLVEAHGGRIEVESTLGAGSAFRVWLPATASRPT